MALCCCCTASRENRRGWLTGCHTPTSQEVHCHLITHKIRMFNSNLTSVLLVLKHGESLPTITRMSRPFWNKYLQHILKLKCTNRVINSELWNRAYREPIDIKIQRGNWQWMGHTLRKDPSIVTCQALEWRAQGKRKRGSPKQTWPQSFISSNLIWESGKRYAKDSSRWRPTAVVLFSTRSEEG